VSVSSLTLSHHSQDLPLGEGPLDEAPPFNVPHHVLPQSPLILIMEHLTITGFAPNSVSTPYGPLRDKPLPVYPVASPTREAPSAFMQPLDQLMNTRSAAPHTQLHGEGLALFRVPYPFASPLTAPTAFIHLPNSHPIARDTSLVLVTCTLNLVAEEYLRTLHLTPQMTQDALKPLVLAALQL